MIDSGIRLVFLPRRFWGVVFHDPHYLRKNAVFVSSVYKLSVQSYFLEFSRPYFYAISLYFTTGYKILKKILKNCRILTEFVTIIIIDKLGWTAGTGGGLKK